jgi:dihydroneopterin aldolase
LYDKKSPFGDLGANKKKGINIAMGLIQIENMEFYAFHGHLKEEQIVGNKFLVDLTIETDMNVPSKSDNLKDAVNYQVACQIIKTEMEKKSHLLENIAGRILDALYSEMTGIKKATIKVSKMNPPMGGKIGSVSVVMER